MWALINTYEKFKSLRRVNLDLLLLILKILSEKLKSLRRDVGFDQNLRLDWNFSFDGEFGSCMVNSQDYKVKSSNL